MSVDLRKFASGIAALRRQHGATYQFDDALVRLVWKRFGFPQSEIRSRGEPKHGVS